MSAAKYEYWLTQDGLILLEAFARDGLNDEQIAEKCGIVPSTLYEWKNKYAKFSEALKKGKEIVDYEVENALYKRAVGYEYEEVKEEYKNGELTSRTVIKKQVNPDVTAQMIWLKNRRPEKWREKQEAQADGEAGVTIELAQAGEWAE